MTTTEPEQWAKDLFWAALKAGDHNNYEAAYAVIQATFAEREARLVGALEEARSGLYAYTGGDDGACSETIRRIDAALAPFTKGQS